MKIALTEEQFENEFNVFWKNAETIGISTVFEDDFKDKMKIATCAINEETGCCYPGALLKHINLITALATRINKMISGTFSIDEKSIIKVCLLMHLSKMEMYVPNDNEWEIKNRGLLYKFAKLEGKLKFGERSILNAMNLGIKLSPEEFEAIKCLDTEKETNGKYFESILTTIVRQANELAYSIEKERYNKMV